MYTELIFDKRKNLFVSKGPPLYWNQYEFKHIFSTIQQKCSTYFNWQIGWICKWYQFFCTSRHPVAYFLSLIVSINRTKMQAENMNEKKCFRFFSLFRHCSNYQRPISYPFRSVSSLSLLCFFCIWIFFVHISTASSKKLKWSSKKKQLVRFVSNIAGGWQVIGTAYLFYMMNNMCSVWFVYVWALSVAKEKMRYTRFCMH